jgi:hypothetical protein
MRSPWRSRSVHSRGATILAGATLVLAVVGCSGGSGTATTAPAASAAASAAASVAAAPSSAPGASSGMGGAGCDGIREAATRVSLETQLLYQADSGERWATMTDPSAPIRLDAGAMAAAVDVLATLPGSGDLVASYRQIVDLERQAGSGDPWGDGSGPGARAHELVKAKFIDLGVALSTLLEAAGC